MTRVQHTSVWQCDREQVHAYTQTYNHTQYSASMRQHMHEYTKDSSCMLMCIVIHRLLHMCWQQKNLQWHSVVTATVYMLHVCVCEYWRLQECLVLLRCRHLCNMNEEKGRRYSNVYKYRAEQWCVCAAVFSVAEFSSRVDKKSHAVCTFRIDCRQSK